MVAATARLSAIQKVCIPFARDRFPTWKQNLLEARLSDIQDKNILPAAFSTEAVDQTSEASLEQTLVIIVTDAT